VLADRVYQTEWPNCTTTKEASVIAIHAGEAAVDLDDGYWADDDAALPVLLIDEATEAITAALHRVRCGSTLDDRDLTAAGVALGDLFGGLGQLADLLLSTAAGQHTTADSLHSQQADRLATLSAMTRSARQTVVGLQRDCLARRRTPAETVPRQRA
jgi:hypothetical protein